MNDLISRQAAISLPVKPKEDRYFQTQNLDDAYDYGWYSLQECIEKLPSAQPEVIRCTECKHYREYDSEYVANAVVVQCMADRYPISETIPDGWFCAGAERRTDDH